MTRRLIERGSMGERIAFELLPDPLLDGVIPLDELMRRARTIMGRGRMKRRVIDRGRLPIGERIEFLRPPDLLRGPIGMRSPLGLFATKSELIALVADPAGERSMASEEAQP